MSVYFDASVLVALFTLDPFTERAKAFMRSTMPAPVVSDFAAAEFASAVARRVRTKDLTPAEARSAFRSFDAWTAQVTQRTQISHGDIRAAETFLRRLDLNLLTPDALHPALAQRMGASLVTFDSMMATCARALKIPVTAA